MKSREDFLKLAPTKLQTCTKCCFRLHWTRGFGIVPPDWKEANVVPLYKKDDRTNPGNYRPISLTSLSCKLLEHVVQSNVMTHLDKFNVLDNAQHGFRKYRSCVTQLITTLNNFSNCLNEKEQTDAILLDFSKAFDKVDHNGLILKLEHFGIRSSLLNWIRSFLVDRKQRVLVAIWRQHQLRYYQAFLKAQSSGPYSS